MRMLIVNADDFGLSPGVNQGIVEAHAAGVLTSTSLMVRRGGALEAGELARAHPSLSVGLHFEEPPGVELDDPAVAGRLFAEQLERFRELAGRDPTHIDSHHHVHLQHERLPIFRALVEPLGVPLRQAGRIGYIGGFYGQWEDGVTDLSHLTREFFLELVRDEAPEGWTELACHPARLIGDFSSSYHDEREVELATLTSPGLRDEISRLGVTLASYHDWLSAASAGA